MLARREICDRLEAIVDLGVPNDRAGRVPGAAELSPPPTARCARPASRSRGSEVRSAKCEVPSGTAKWPKSGTVRLSEPGTQRLATLRSSIASTTASTRATPRRIPSSSCGRYARRDDREIVGFCAAALAFGRVPRVMASVEAAARAAWARRRPRSSGRSIPTATAPRFARSCIAGRAARDLVGARLGAAADARAQRLDRGSSSSRATIPAAADVGDGARVVLAARAGARPDARLRPARRRADRRAATSSRGRRRQRLQAAEPVPALDGPARRRSISASGRASRRRGSSCRSTRTSSGWASACGLTRYREPRLADGGRHHRVAARASTRRSGALRLLALPRRHDGQLRVRPQAARLAVSAAGRVLAAPLTRHEARRNSPRSRGEYGESHGLRVSGAAPARAGRSELRRASARLWTARTVARARPRHPRRQISVAPWRDLRARGVSSVAGYGRTRRASLRPSARR